MPDKTVMFPGLKRTVTIYDPTVSGVCKGKNHVWKVVDGTKFEHHTCSCHCDIKVECAVCKQKDHARMSCYSCYKKYGTCSFLQVRSIQADVRGNLERWMDLCKYIDGLEKSKKDKDFLEALIDSSSSGGVFATVNGYRFALEGKTAKEDFIRQQNENRRTRSYPIIDVMKPDEDTKKLLKDLEKFIKQEKVEKEEKNKVLDGKIKEELEKLREQRVQRQGERYQKYVQEQLEKQRTIKANPELQKMRDVLRAQKLARMAMPQKKIPGKQK